MKLWIAVVAALAAAGPAAPEAGPLDEASLREKLRELFLRDAQSDFAQCAPLDGEAKRFAASEDLPLIEISLGNRLDALTEGSRDYFGSYQTGDMQAFTNDMMRISVDVGAERILSKTGGMHNVVTMIDASYGENRIHSIEFYDQQCPLALQVALERAHALEAKLTSAGFEREPALIAREEYGDYSPETLPNWQEGAAALDQTPRVVAAVSSRWSRGGQEATVTVWNWGAPKPKPPFIDLLRDMPEVPGSVFELDDTGRKYGVQFRISEDSIFEDGFDAIDAGAIPKQ